MDMDLNSPRSSSSVSPASLSSPFYFLRRFSSSDKDQHLVRLPDELLLLILALLPHSDRVSMLRVCTSLHFLVSRSIYSTVRVSGKRARLFFVTLATSSRFSTVYATFPRRLSYSVTSATDMYLTYPVFCQALNLLGGLHTLSLDIASAQSKALMLALTRYGLLRERLLLATALFQSSQGRVALGDRSGLPRLKTLRVGGDPVVAALAVHCDVREIILVGELQYKQLSELCCRLNSSVYGSNISVLGIKLVPTLDMLAVLHALAEILPNLEDFSVDQKGSDTLATFRFLAGPDRPFSALKNLTLNHALGWRLNCALGWRLNRMLEVDRVSEKVVRFLEQELPSGSGLCSVRLGSTTWTLNVSTYRWLDGVQGASY
ncbi:hypothetical protein B0H17DRAFT_1227864 [Mycena rosella]|uniref:F-box domain-containing protein n=1 Tax=Mycena rosella TaxID=1033263 RepID=A0AAD7GEE4_MYCRO|nr:hypothetical protein B0H17DRAFT_1227864 [Mycena rosella]